MAFGGLKISGMYRGEWIVSEYDVWMEEIATHPRMAKDPESLRNIQQRRPYYLRRLAIFGRELNVWVPDYASRSQEEMNQWAIDKLLNSHVSNAMNTYGSRIPQEQAAS